MAPAPSPRRKLLQLPFVTSPVYRELVILDIIGAPVTARRAGHPGREPLARFAVHDGLSVSFWGGA